MMNVKVADFDEASTEDLTESFNVSTHPLGADKLQLPEFLRRHGTN